MPNFGKLFQEEVRRLTRKETKADLDRLKREQVSLRRAISAAHKTINALQRELQRVRKGTGTVSPVSDDSEEQSGGPRTRYTGKTILAMRTKLGVTQAEFAKLAGVTGQSVYQWERREGQLTFRRGAKARLDALRGVGAREARKRLADMKVERKRGPRKKAA